MSPRFWQDRIRDIIDALQEIEMFTAAMTFAQFAIDSKTIKAVNLNLIIIGEATNSVPDDIQAANPQIPWPLMRAMRNRLMQVYFSVDAKIIWDTVKSDLPGLVPNLRSLLDA